MIKIPQVNRKLTLKVFCLIVTCEAVDAAAQILMKKGLSALNLNPLSFEGLLRFASESTDSGFVQLGLLIYTLNFFIWILILSKLDLSTAVPLTSVNYLILPLFSVLILHEKISVVRWIGILLIIFGVVWISRSKSENLKGPTLT
ncbi:MAG: hypothetical protein AUJ72_01030 [Candidatus Omnitrophica bacterium CG1_02_46_14]|nr:MAG: hypothetical protein AUJ72_01030 [Candidatus Omnitrophica bacterium CG1_02_46_14]